MKIYRKLLAFSLLTTLVVPTFVSAAETAPNVSAPITEWTQYRAFSDKNAVFHTNNDLYHDIAKVYPTSDEVRSTPVIVGDTLYIGNQHESEVESENVGTVSAFNVHDGTLKWKLDLPNWTHSEVIYRDNLVYFGIGNRMFKDGGVRGTGKNGVYAVNASSGEVVWFYETDGEVMPTPVIYDDSLYVVSGDSHLYQLDLKTGKEQWKLDLGSYVSMSSPNLTDGVLYFGGSDPYAFFAVDLDTRKVRWKIEIADLDSGLDDVPPATANGLVFSTAVKSNKNPSDPFEHMLYAFDINDGSIEWMSSLGYGAMVADNKSGAPMVYNDTLYLGSPLTKTFYAYDLNGKILWSYKNDAGIKAPPVADNGIVYFTDGKGFIKALDAKSGAFLGSRKLGGALAPAGPILVDNNAIVGSQDGNVYGVPVTDILTPANAIAYGLRFTDFSDPDHPAYEAVVYGVEKGYVNGYTDSTLRIDQPLTSKEARILLSKVYPDSVREVDIDHKTLITQKEWLTSVASAILSEEVSYETAREYFLSTGVTEVVDIDLRATPTRADALMFLYRLVKVSL